MVNVYHSIKEFFAKARQRLHNWRNVDVLILDTSAQPFREIQARHCLSLPPTLLINTNTTITRRQPPQSSTSYTRHRQTFLEVKQCLITIDSSLTEFKTSQHHATVINASLSVCLARRRGYIKFYLDLILIQL